MQEEAAHDAVAALRHLGVAGGGDLVEPVGAVGHPRPFGPEVGEGPGEEIGVVGTRHAHQLPGDAGGVRQRAEEVEDGAHAQLAPSRGGMPHRGMERGGEQERDAAGVEAALDHRGGRVDRDPEGGEDVGAAAAARDGAVAVLGDGHPARGEDEGGERRDVERRRPVAAGAAGVEPGPLAGRQRHRVGAHRLRQPHDLGRALALHRQRDEQPRDLGGGGAPRHDLLHRARRLVDAQVLPAVQPLYQVGEHVSSPGSCAESGGRPPSAPTRDGTARRGRAGRGGAGP